MLRDECQARNRLAIRSNDVRRVAYNETIGMARNREILFNGYGAVRSNTCTERFCQ